MELTVEILRRLHKLAVQLNDPGLEEQAHQLFVIKDQVYEAANARLQHAWDDDEEF